MRLSYFLVPPAFGLCLACFPNGGVQCSADTSFSQGTRVGRDGGSFGYEEEDGGPIGGEEDGGVSDSGPIGGEEDGGVSDSGPRPDGGSSGDAGGPLPISGVLAWQVPPGAVPDDITLGVTPAPNAPPVPHATIVGTPFELTPEGQAFLEPVTLDVPFWPTQLPAGKTPADVLVYTAPLGSTAYRPIEGTLVGWDHIRIQVNHFCIFVAAVPE